MKKLWILMLVISSFKASAVSPQQLAWLQGKWQFKQSGYPLEIQTDYQRNYASFTLFDSIQTPGGKWKHVSCLLRYHSDEYMISERDDPFYNPGEDQYTLEVTLEVKQLELLSHVKNHIDCKQAVEAYNHAIQVENFQHIKQEWLSKAKDGSGHYGEISAEEVGPKMQKETESEDFWIH